MRLDLPRRRLSHPPAHAARGRVRGRLAPWAPLVRDDVGAVVAVTSSTASRPSRSLASEPGIDVLDEVGNRPRASATTTSPEEALGEREQAPQGDGGAEREDEDPVNPAERRRTVADPTAVVVLPVLEAVPSL